MKKVLFVATVDSHINNFHLPYMKWFKEHGYEVHVATNSIDKIYFCDKKHKLEIRRSPFSIKNIKAIQQLKKIIEKEKFEIIHCNTPMGGVVARLAAMKARKCYATKVIYTAHGFHFFKGAPIFNWIIYYPIEKFLSYITDCLVTINEEDYLLAKKKLKAKQIEYVHGVGISQTKFKKYMSNEEIIEKKKKIGVDLSSFIILYVAELNKNKNQIALINIMKEIKKYKKDVKLLLAGDGKLRKKLEKEINKQCLQNDVFLLGYREDIAELMNISDFVISASKREGLPMNILEALFCNVPVIATDIRGHRDLIDSEYLLKKISADQIKEKIDEINKNGYKQKIDLNKYKIEEVIKEFQEKNIYPNKRNSPIRILQIIRAMNVGGAETFIMNLYRNINRSQIQFDFLVSRDGFFDQEIKKMGGKIFKIPYLTDVGQIEYTKNLKEFFKTHHNYKIIHSHIDQVSGLILKIANKCDIPIRISHSHNTKNTNGIFGKIYKKYLQNKINTNATDLLACEQEAANWLFKENADKELIIKNGIEVEKFEFSIEKRKKIRQELQIDDSTVLIGHVGRFQKVKNHSFLLDIFKEYHNINRNSKLILVGDGPLKNDIEKKVKKLNLEKWVIFLGIRTDVDYIYSALDVLVFPSLFEGLSFALIESQTAGLPTYTSDTIDPNTKVTDKLELISLNKSAKEWAEKIQVLPIKHRRDELKKIRANGYDIKESVAKIEKFYINKERK